MSEMRASCSVQEISYETARGFIRGEKSLILKRDYKYYALINSDQIVSALAVKEAQKIKVHCNYTPPTQRGKGYFTKLLLFIIERYKNYEITADCLDASKDIYLRCGFELTAINRFKSFTIYKMRMSKRG